MRRLPTFAIPLLIATTALLLASCDETDDPTVPEEDTTAPLVVSMDPADGDSGVSTDEEIHVGFSEAMDPASVTGAVTLSHGTITDLTWLDDRVLEIEHSGLPEGTEITVTIGVGLTDVAGNALAAAVTSSFWTETSVFTLLWSSPEDGATDVVRTSMIMLQFSRDVDMTTVENGVSVSPGPMATVYPVTFTDLGDGLVRLDPDDPLPATTAIRVDISPTVESSYGAAIDQAHTVDFTTGEDLDTTPPQLLSLEPADGSVMDPDIGFLRLTFDEPIDPSFEPVWVSAQLMMSMLGQEPLWSEGGTVITVPLVSPLPAGMTLAVEFDSFMDLNGNVNDTGFTWSATVAGDPDHFPVEEDVVPVFAGQYSEGTDKDGYEEYGYVHEWENGTDFRRYRIHSSDPADWQEWDNMSKTSSAILFRGFREYDWYQEEGWDVTFSPPPEYLRLPVATGSWSGAGTMTFPDGTGDLTYSVEVQAGLHDVPFDPGWDKTPTLGGPGDDDGPDMDWVGCRRVIITHTVAESGQAPFETGTDTLYLAPGIGPVKESSYTVEDNGDWRWSTAQLYMIMPLDELIGD